MSDEERHTIRIDNQKIGELFAFYGINGDDFQSKHRLFIDELHKKLLLYKNSQVASEQAGEQKPDIDKLTCRLRKPLEDSPSGYGCIERPPRIVTLKTLAICEVCKALGLNLSDKTKRLAEEIEKAQKTPDLKQAPEIQQVSKPLEAQATQKSGYTGGYTGTPSKHYETTYCPQGGLYVPLEKCARCKTSSFNVYDTCQRIFKNKQSQPSKT